MVSSVGTCKNILITTDSPVIIFLQNVLDDLMFIRSGLFKLLISKKYDVVICIGKLPLLMVNLLTGKRRQIIAFEWMYPPKRKPYLLEKLAVRNQNYVVVTNSPNLKQDWRSFFGNIDIKARFALIPNVYEYVLEFQRPFIKKQKYVFCGGFTNRDWAATMKTARLMPDVKFVCAMLKSDFDAQLTSEEIPDNVQIFYNIPGKEYYQKMHDASVVVITLRNEKVSGLINIVHSAVEGVLCIINSTDATKQYYTDDNKDLLIPTKDPEIWAKKIAEVLNYSEDEYVKRAETFQSYIRENFSPSKAAEKIYSLIQE